MIRQENPGLLDSLVALREEHQDPATVLAVHAATHALSPGEIALASVALSLARLARIDQALAQAGRLLDRLAARVDAEA